MSFEIDKASTIGFCFGVRRAIDMLERIAAERGSIETLGQLVHNRLVLDRLEKNGVIMVERIDQIKGDTIVISAHGVSPKVIDELEGKGLNIIDTTCSFVKRAQTAASKLADSGFYTVVYGDANHVEVKGILGWADGKGIATVDVEDVKKLDPIPKKLGILSQTTQIPDKFIRFVKDALDLALVRDAEIRVIDTICHDIRKRQTDALELAKKVDLMIVIGSHHSANTKHLVQLCSNAAETIIIENAKEITKAQLKGKKRIGITAGASTDDQVINEVYDLLSSLR